MTEWMHQKTNDSLSNWKTIKGINEWAKEKTRELIEWQINKEKTKEIKNKKMSEQTTTNKSMNGWIDKLSYKKSENKWRNEESDSERNPYISQSINE